MRNHFHIFVLLCNSLLNHPLCSDLFDVLVLHYSSVYHSSVLPHNRNEWHINKPVTLGSGGKTPLPIRYHKRIRDSVIAGNLTFVIICREDCFYREQCRKKKKKNLIPSSLPKLNHGIRGKSAIALYTRRRQSRNARQKRLVHYTHHYLLCSIFVWPSLLHYKMKSLREREFIHRGIRTNTNHTVYFSQQLTNIPYIWEQLSLAI